MLFWLAKACKDAREQMGRIQSQVAASAVVDQSTINRFESAAGWPRNTDRIVAGYADDLNIEPVDLWQEGIRLWRTHLADEALNAADGGAGSTPRREGGAKRAADGRGRRRAG